MTLSSGELLILRDYLNDLSYGESFVGDFKNYHALKISRIEEILKLANIEIKDSQIVFNTEIDNQYTLIQRIYASYIFNTNPIWFKYAWGGKAKVSAMIDEVSQGCIEQLFPYSSEFEDDWWMMIMHKSRALFENEKQFIGFQGEKLALKFEEKRVNETPLKMFMENSGAGYDLESKNAIGSKDKRYIEVKTTKGSFNQGTAHITKNEFNKSKDLQNYYFYFVSIEEGSITIFDSEDVNRHAPHDFLDGKWEVFKVEFEAVKNLSGTKNKTVSLEF